MTALQKNGNGLICLLSVNFLNYTPLVKNMSHDFIRNLIIKRFFSADEEGIKLFKNINYLTVQANSMAVLLQKIGEKKGSQYLFDIGYEAGWDAADEMMNYMKLPSIPVPAMRQIQGLLEIIGFGRFEAVVLKPKEGKVLIRVSENPVIDAGKQLFGKELMVCSFYRGVYSAHGEREIKIKDCRLKEDFCITQGRTHCQWSSGLK